MQQKIINMHDFQCWAKTTVRIRIKGKVLDSAPQTGTFSLTFRACVEKRIFHRIALKSNLSVTQVKSWLPEGICYIFLAMARARTICHFSWSFWLPNSLSRDKATLVAETPIPELQMNTPVVTCKTL